MDIARIKSLAQIPRFEMSCEIQQLSKPCGKVRNGPNDILEPFVIIDTVELIVAIFMIMAKYSKDELGEISHRDPQLISIIHVLIANFPDVRFIIFRFVHLESHGNKIGAMYIRKI